ncbi:hypothetical protein Ct9H90mP29_20170 [bacterium]|nr:MAG: hypothetical protein Ct9H90mP29_20170 [bacterium]
MPAWGPKGSYAEWYLSGLNNGDTARLRYHHDNYGKRIFLIGSLLIFSGQKIMIQINGLRFLKNQGQNMWFSHQSIMMVFVFGQAKKVKVIIL